MISSAIQPDSVGVVSILKTRTPEVALPFSRHVAGAISDQTQDQLESAAKPSNVRAEPSVARQAAEEFVAAAFIEPILAHLRETSQAEGPFAPTAAEKRFGPLLDQRIADRVVRGARFPIVDAIEARLESRPTGEINHVA